MFERARQSIRNVRGLGFGRRAIWTNARMAFADVPIDARAASGWLPRPLVLASPPRATVFIASYPQTAFGSVYREAALLLGVRMFGVRMAFCPWMVVDDDRALILGRELLGYPKKMADIRFEESGGTFSGSVTRRGAEVLRVEGRVGESVRKPPPGIGRRAVNVRGLMTFTPSHLLVFHPEESVRECRALDARVTLTSSDDDPIGIAEGPAERATIRSCDIGSPPLRLPLRVFPVPATFALSQLQLRVR